MAIKSVDYDKYDPWQRAFQGQIDADILIDGIRDYDTAIKAHRKAHQYDAPAEHKERIAAKLREYSDE